MKRRLLQKQVLQIVYGMWPDHATPSSTGVVLDVIAKVEKHQQTLTDHERKVTLVHCRYLGRC